MVNLITEYTETIKKYLDAPEIFIEASAYHLVSSLLGRYTICPVAPGVNGLRPNAWIMISSIPARGRRSTVTSYQNKVYYRCLRKFYDETEGRRLREEDTSLHQRINETFIEQGTPEGIMDHINNTKYKEYYICSTEFGSVLQGMGTKEWEMGVSVLYSKLYYGESHTTHLSQKSNEEGQSKRYLPPDLYVTMFTSLQEPHLYITPAMMRQGLIRRILLIYAGKDQFDRWIEPMNFGRTNLNREFYRISELFSDRMLKYYSYAKDQRDKDGKKDQTIDIDLLPSSIKAINKYAYELEKELVNNISLSTIYKQTLWEHLAKYSMLHSIARGSIKKTGKHICGRVDSEDIKAAKSFVKRATINSEEIISELGRYDTPVRITDSPVERIYAIIKNSQPIDRSMLLRKSKMLKRELEEIVVTLAAQKRVGTRSDGIGNRRKTVYITLD